MYVGRSGGGLIGASAEFCRFGLAGPQAANALLAGGLPAPEAPLAVAHAGDATVIRLEASRLIVVLPAPAAAERFAALVGADTFPVRKPDPVPYRAAVERAGGTVARSMLVGDTETDAKTGLAAGVPVALVTFGPEGRGVERFAPAALLDRFEDLPGLADRLLR